MLRIKTRFFREFMKEKSSFQPILQRVPSQFLTSSTLLILGMSKLRVMIGREVLTRWLLYLVARVAPIRGQEEPEELKMGSVLEFITNKALIGWLIVYLHKSWELIYRMWFLNSKDWVFRIFSHSNCWKNLMRGI